MGISESSLPPALTTEFNRQSTVPSRPWQLVCEPGAYCTTTCTCELEFRYGSKSGEIFSVPAKSEAGKSNRISKATRFTVEVLIQSLGSGFSSTGATWGPCEGEYRGFVFSSLQSLHNPERRQCVSCRPGLDKLSAGGRRGVSFPRLTEQNEGPRAHFHLAGSRRAAEGIF